MRWKNRHAAVHDVMARMGLADRADQLAGQLSGGWKQRLALAACVLHQPKLLLLDEPTAGVDAKARREFWDLIHDMALDGLTVLVSTHYMDEAERCTRIVYLSNGHIVVQGTADEVTRGAHLITFGKRRARALRTRCANCARCRASNRRRCSADRCTSPGPIERRWSARPPRTARTMGSIGARSNLGSRMCSSIC